MATKLTGPIWKDTYYTTSASTANYYIELDGGKIFSGRAYRYPDADNLEINVNKICRNYLSCDIAELFTVTPMPAQVNHPNARRTFQLYVDNVNVQDYEFYQDYSYTDNMPSGGTVVVSDPINGHYFPGMLKLRTTRTSSSYYTQASTTTSTGYGYTTRVKCVPYVLYYLNSYGGWDSFVIEGTGLKKDAITTYKTDRVYKNTTPQFETNKYVQEIKTNYELNTGLLTDEQAANLAKNLIGSIKVYMQNVDEGWIKPVIITDSNVTYQTYQTNGRKLCQYKIQVTESQSKIRK